jgi:hypothetical protein
MLVLSSVKDSFMPLARRSQEEQLALGVDDVVRLGVLLDELSIVATGPDQVSVHHEDGIGWPARVVTYEAVDEATAKQLVATRRRGQQVLVANRISEPARKYLTSRGWAWLDRRFGAHLRIGRRDIEIRYTNQSDPTSTNDDGSGAFRLSKPAADGPIRGRAGIAYAAAVLCNRDDTPSFRSIAKAVNMSPTAISNAVKHLTAAGLLGPDHKPILPELFWVLAEVWSPVTVVALASLPDPDNPEISARIDNLDQSGWVLGGDAAAAELGAPVFSVGNRPWLWVPTEVEVRRAERTYGSSNWSDRVAVVATPPTPLVCQWRHPAPPGGSPWPLPHPVFAALDLARDPGRGREILDQWSPDGADAVWR